MSEFESWRSYWRFVHSVQTKRRYLHTEKVRLFLNTVLETGHKRSTEIPKGSIFWHSQLGSTFESRGDDEEQIEEEVAFPPERMKPRKNSAKEGRVNPKGIPCLYLSNDKDTALSEVRPWVGSSISLGRFQTKRILKAIDFPEDDGKGSVLYLGGKEPSPEKRELAVWRNINRAFSTPVTSSDDQAEYVPTQILAELFKSNGYDGLVFKSSCGEGHNIALFDIDAAKMLSGHVYSAKSVHFSFRESSNPYFLKEPS